MVVPSKESCKEGKKRTVNNDDDYLIHYKISTFMHDPKNATFHGATYGGMKS